MPTVLLIGGPLHGQIRNLPEQDRIEVTLSERMTPIPTYGFRGHELQRVERETAVYVRCEAAEGVCVLEGYEPTPDDEGRVREWLRD